MLATAAASRCMSTSLKRRMPVETSGPSLYASVRSCHMRFEEALAEEAHYEQ